MTKATAEKAYELGKEYEKVYTGCSQCVIAALQDAFGMKNDGLFKASTGLAAGGAGCIDGSCGAYSGAILVLGSLLGRDRDNLDDIDVIMRNGDLARKFRSKYIQEYGSVVCRNIQTRVLGRPYYLADPEDFQKFHDAGAHDIYCPEVVGKAARWTAEIVQEAGLAP